MPCSWRSWEARERYEEENDFTGAGTAGFTFNEVVTSTSSAPSWGVQPAGGALRERGPASCLKRRESPMSGPASGMSDPREDLLRTAGAQRGGHRPHSRAV